MRRSSLLPLALCWAACAPFEPSNSETDAAPAETDAVPLLDAAPIGPACLGIEAEHLCEDFESGLDDNWMVTANDGVIELVTDPVVSGNRALHIQRTFAGFSILNLPINRVASGSLYARAFLQRRGMPLDTFFVAMEARGPFGDEFQKISVDLNANDRVDLTGDGFVSSPDGVFPPNTWKCFEFFVEIADVGGTATVSVDGEKVAELVNVDTLPDQGIENFFIGISTPAPNQELFIDAFALSADPLGCPPLLLQ